MWGRLHGVFVLVVLCSVVAGTSLCVSGPATGQPAGELPDAGAPTAADSSIRERPLADAGLDQTVPLGVTVYLDGGGSTDPDGDIVAYDWTVQLPNGTQVTPRCTATGCERASFAPAQPGTYNVTLVVTDDDDQTATDYLYVTVTEQRPPSAALSGPEALAVNETGAFRLRGERGDNRLAAVTWRVEDSREGRTVVDGGRTWTLTRRFPDAGTYTVSGTLTDVVGLSATAEQTVRVDPETESGFAVTITDTNSPVPVGETATVTARVENTGDERATRPVTYEGPPAEASRSVTLAGGATTTETFRWATDDGDAGTYPVAVSSPDDTARTSIGVVNRSAPYFDVEITDTNSPVAAGDQLRVEGTVTNTGPASDTQSVVAEVEWESGSEATSSEVSLSGTEDSDTRDSEEVAFAFDTAGREPGRYTVTLDSRNDSAAREVSLTGTGPVVEVTDVGGSPPSTTEDGYVLSVTVENTGDEATASTVLLRAPGRGKTAARVRVAGLDPGERRQLRADADGVTWVMDASQGVDFCGGANQWEAFCSSGVGWGQWDDQTVQFRATTDSWNGSTSEMLEVPELPAFDVEIRGFERQGDGGSTYDEVVGWAPKVTVTNRGEISGQFTVTTELIESLWDEPPNPVTGVDELGDKRIQTPQNLGAWRTELNPGEQWQSWTPENRFWTDAFHDAQKQKDTIEVKAQARPQYGPDEQPIDDYATGETSWEANPPDPPDSEFNCPSDPRLDIVTEEEVARSGKEVPYSVHIHTCDGDGNPTETPLDPAEYSAVWYGSSEDGPVDGEVRVTDTFIWGKVGCSHEDSTKAFSFEVTTNNGDLRSTDAVTFERRETTGC